MKKKNWFKAFAVITAVVFIGLGLTACEGPEGPMGPQGPQGDPGSGGSGVLTVIPVSSGLRGTSWTNSGATGTNNKTIGFSSNGETITYERANGDILHRKVIAYRNTTTEELGETHFIESMFFKVDPNVTETTTWTPGALTSVLYHVKDNVLKMDYYTTEFTKEVN